MGQKTEDNWFVCVFVRERQRERERQRAQNTCKHHCLKGTAPTDQVHSLVHMFPTQAYINRLSQSSTVLSR